MATDNDPITKMADAPSVDTLDRLARLDAGGHPLLSVYVDLDRSRFPTPDTREAQVASLLDEARREVGDSEAKRIKNWLQADGAIAQDAGGLAIFCSERANIFEVVRLPTPVEPLVVADTVPWLEPLAALTSPGNWGVAVVSRRAARLFRGGPDGLTEFAAIEHPLHRRHAQGGWSQARFARGIEQQVAEHVQGVVDRLLRAHRHRPFGHLVIVCSDELRPVISHSLHAQLRDALAGMVDADLEHASVGQIAQAIGPVLERADREQESALVEVIEQGLATGGAAAAGLDEVLSTLRQQRVDTLVVPVGSTMDGGIEHAVEEAARQSAQIVVLHHESEWLHEHGEIAAVLRW